MMLKFFRKLFEKPRIEPIRRDGGEAMWVPILGMFVMVDETAQGLKMLVSDDGMIWKVLQQVWGGHWRYLTVMKWRDPKD